MEQWREDQNEAREALAALGLVRAELLQNLDELAALTPTRRTTLEAYQAGIAKLINDDVYPNDLPTVEKPAVTTIAYELATDTGAVTTVAAEDLLIIARAYEALGAVKRNEVSLNERNAQIRYRDGEQYLSGFIYYLNGASGNEPYAIAHIEKAIALLDERLGSP